eukprot:3100756-Amphidinium_carterae.1
MTSLAHIAKELAVDMALDNCQVCELVDIPGMLSASAKTHDACTRQLLLDDQSVAEKVCASLSCVTRNHLLWACQCPRAVRLNVPSCQLNSRVVSRCPPSRIRFSGSFIQTCRPSSRYQRD